MNYAQQKKTTLKRKQKTKKEGDYIEGAAEFNITLAEGRANLYPEIPVTVTGFKPTIDCHQWGD
ncbi:hypothetical protein [Providencia stuartii]|uniref:hypothetical protein n=1 Tax=Providencia stuartii TaxID=588 RepID=UPI003A4D3B6A